MPIIKSAAKRMRQTTKRHARNVTTKRSLRAELKSFSTAIAAKDAKKAAQELKKVQSKVDLAVKKNVLKKNTAARKLSSLNAQLKTLGAKPATTAKKIVEKPAAKATTKAVAKKVPAKKPAAKKTPVKKAVAKK